MFEESFDAKPCFSPEFIEQKLTYMHYNPVKGKWNLVADFGLYPHSSAGLYCSTNANVFNKITRVGDKGWRRIPGLATKAKLQRP